MANDSEWQARTAPILASERAGVRYLHFGSRLIQGAMRIARPSALELEYTRDMMFPLLLRSGGGWPRSVLLIGLGAASLTRFLYRHRPRAAQTVVEIEPAVIAVAQQYFKLPAQSARLRIEIADGSDFVASSKQRFDLILVDGYDAKGRTGMLDTLPFYCNCVARLSERGALAANLMTRHHGIGGSLDRLRAAFTGRALPLPKCASGNVVIVAAGGDAVDIPGIELARRARRLYGETGLCLLPTVTRLRAALGADAALRI
ncbi:MAG: fused MFS/spermidine synthase [Burkholderiales bacterium]|nr:fused MFS/spermidine synthase [Burkholderiales bacterium]